jgi:hypothetical protein
MFRMYESHGQEHEVRVDRELRAGDALEFAALEFDTHAVQALDAPVAFETLGGDAEIALTALFV